MRLLVVALALLIGANFFPSSEAKAQEDVDVAMFTDMCINDSIVASCHQIVELYASEEIGLDDLDQDALTSRGKMIKAHEISCDNKRGEACHTLQWLYRLRCNFDCTSQDRDQYVVAHSKGCDLNYLPSCLEVGMYHLVGQGSLPVDKIKARAFFDKVCNQGPDQCAAIAAKVNSVDEDERLLADIFVPYALQACPADGSGNPQYCMDVATIIDIYKRPEDFEHTFRIMDTLCEQHQVAEGCHYKGLFIENGAYGATKDPVKAAAAYRKACDLGMAEACR